MGAFSRGKFVRYLVARRAPTVLLDAVHAASPRSDAHTGEIAEAAARRLGSHCVIALVSRTRADLNRPRSPANAAAINEYRGAIRACLESTGLFRLEGSVRTPFLHLAVHGMKNTSRCDIEIGTRHGRTCSRDVELLVVDVVRRWASTEWVSRSPCVAANVRFIGDISKVVHREGHSDSGYAGYGPGFNTVQLEFAAWLRQRHRVRVVEALVEIGTEFQGQYPFAAPR